MPSRPPSALSSYLEDIAKYPLLSDTEKEQIDDILLRGSEEEILSARNNLVKHNLRLVIPIAERYARRGKEDIMDLIQEGNLALSMASKNYIPHHGASFSTYASIYIEHYIRLATRKYASFGLNKKQASLYARIEAIKFQLSSSLGREATLEEIEKELDGVAKKHEIASLLSLSYSNDIDALPSNEEISSNLEEDELRELVHHSLSILEEKERFVVLHYFGLEGSAKQSLTEIGRQLGVSKERARQIKETAIFKMEQRKGGLFYGG